MMRLAKVVALGVVVGWNGVLSAQTSQPVGPEPLEVLDRLYKPFCYPEDSLGYPMKVRYLVGLAREGGGKAELKFSTASRELFYLWAREACGDWLGDLGAYVQCHGDVHLGNTGSYCSEMVGAGGEGCRLALGLKDFDETAVMPFQTDLLQAMVSLRLQAVADGMKLADAEVADAAHELVRAYREAASSGKSATEILGGDPRVASMLEVEGEKAKRTLRDAADDFVQAGRFKPVVKKKGKVKEILRPALRELEAGARYDRALLAGAISRAVAVSPGLAKVLAGRSREDFLAAIEDAALRTHLTSGGSQGLSKVMVYLSSEVKSGGGMSDVIVYLKEEPQLSAGQRAGYAARTEVAGGRRVAEGGEVLCDPVPGAVSWVNMAGRSFVVTVRNPWEEEPEWKIEGAEDLRFAARYLGTLLGAAHGHALGSVEKAQRLCSRATGALEGQLVHRSAAYITVNRVAMGSLLADERVRKISEIADQELSAASTRP